MQRQLQCNFCTFEFVESASQCPHCGRPSLFPNVTAAQDPAEASILVARYKSAKEMAKRNGFDEILAKFESAASKARPVICRPLLEMQRLVTSDNEIYATYYQLLAAGVRLPRGEKWDILRAVADDALFPRYKDVLRFGALSLDGFGCFAYGECHLELREDMIAHRASVFEENSVLWLEHQGIRVADVHNLPRGFRATWEERAKLCVAKLAKKIAKVTDEREFPAVLLQPTDSTAADFVELQIYGPLTARSLASVRLPKGLKRAKKVIAEAVAEKLGLFGVPVTYY